MNEDKFPYDWAPTSSVMLKIRSALIDLYSGGATSDDAITNVKVGESNLPITDGTVTLGTASTKDFGNSSGNLVEVGSDGKIPSAVLPAIKVYNILVCDDQEIDTMPELVTWAQTQNPPAKRGDVIILNNTGSIAGNYIVVDEEVINEDSLVATATPGDAVTSVRVNGSTLQPANGLVTLSDYYTKSESDSANQSVQNTLKEKLNTSDLGTTELNTLETTSKTIPEAINEVKASVEDIDLSGYVPTTRTVNSKALSANITINKSDVGLGNVDNTSDLNKPISNATQTALNAKQNTSDDQLDTTNKTIVGAINEIKASVDDINLEEYVPVTRTINGNALNADVTLDKSDVGLGNVDNTSDLNKPISTAVQSALDAKQNANDNLLSTTAKTVVGAINELKSSVDDIDPSGYVPNTRTVAGKPLSANVTLGIEDITDLQTTLDGKADSTDLDNYVAKTTTVNGKALSSNVTINVADISGLQTTLDEKLNTSDLGTTELSTLATPSKTIPEAINEVLGVNYKYVELLSSNRIVEVNPELTASGGTATWTIHHSLNTVYFIIQVYKQDDTMNSLVPVFADVVINSLSEITITINADANVPAKTYLVVAMCPFLGDVS